MQQLNTIAIEEEPPSNQFEGLRLSPYRGFKNLQFQTICLDDTFIPEFIDVQKLIFKSLSIDKQHHMKVRNADDLKTHLSAPMPIIGIVDTFNNNKLVAQGLVSYARFTQMVKNLEGYPIFGEQVHTTAVIQALGIHPDYTGLGLSQTVLDTAKDLAGMAGMVQLIGKVADDNPPSHKAFVKNSFTIAATGFDPVKGYPVSYFSADLQHRTAAPVGLALVS